MVQGTVKWYNEGQGRGAVISDSDGGEVSVACSDIAADGFKILFEGQRVMFDVVRTAKGPAARNLVLSDGE
jgi:CspA family cold shock protein